jgi:hypothetical protein
MRLPSPSLWELPGCRYYLGVYFRDGGWFRHTTTVLLALILWRVW